VRRIQIHIDEELDDLLAVESARSGQSKASLIRSCVATRFKREEPVDAMTALIGAFDGPATESIDDIVYG
jgi:hypothetical protein